MDDLSLLEQRIEERLAAAKERRMAEQTTVRRDMEEREQRTIPFAAAAQRRMDSIIRPRMLKLASLFRNSHPSDKDVSVGYGVVCEFDHTPEYPAGTRLEIGISADAAMENMILTYNLQILPIYFQFDGHDQFVVSLSAVDDGAVAAWMDRKVLDFTDTYLKLQVIDQYQQENMVVDPVCGMRINRAIAAGTAQHNGRSYYFCAEQCQRKFTKDPERYATTRR
jgi:YHS domain-containing protein